MSEEAGDILTNAIGSVSHNKTDKDKEIDERMEKRSYVEQRSLDRRYRQEKESEELTSRYEEIDLDVRPQDVEQIIKNNNFYFEHAAKKKLFLRNKVFEGVVPFHGKQLILIAANTGAGKSTISANITYHDMAMGGHPLVITNEETIEDVFNRNTCLEMGWHYVSHSNFSQARVDVLNRSIKEKSPFLTVITDTHNDAPFGVTTTLEGIQGVLTAALRRYKETGKFYSSIIIDYYQGIAVSSKDPSLVNWQVQEKLALFLDSFKNQYPGPIIVLSQLKPGDEDFKTRIEGRKMILNKATVAMEVVADKEKMATQFKLHKGRYTEKLGNSLMVGYDRGMFVEYTDDFQLKVQTSRQRAISGNPLKSLGDKKDEIKNEDFGTSINKESSSQDSSQTTEDSNQKT